MRSKSRKEIGDFYLPAFTSVGVLIPIVILLLLVSTKPVMAQGIESPPVTSFRPDTSLPKVSVPEFVITGRAQTDEARFNKESTRIDSSYFQDMTLTGLGMDIPINQSLSLQSMNSKRANLFAQISTGSYATTSYLLSGDGAIGDARVNGSLGGNYTSGFIPQTIRRDVAVHAGVEKDMEFGESTRTSNSAEVGYSRASYFLYGSGIPYLLRTTNQFDIGLRSDMNLGNFPLTAGLNFDRFSVQDQWKDIQSNVNLDLETDFSLPSGSIDLDGSFRFGNHGTTPPSNTLLSLTGISESSYDFRLGADYVNVVGGLSYSAGLTYFQYADDFSRGIAKLYPDLRGTYRLNDRVSLFARFYGRVDDPSLSTFFTRNQYVDANFPLKNSQDYANFTIGGNWIATNEISVIPKINIEASRFYPFFVTLQTATIGSDTVRADNQLLNASKATIFTATVTAKYKADKFGADATLNVRSGTADSLSSIPNLAPFDLTIGGSYQITPQFAFKASLLILSSRYSDLTLTSRLGSAWLLNFHLSYGLNIGHLPVEIFADGRNLLDQKYYIWRGYQEFPLGLFIGASARIM